MDAPTRHGRHLDGRRAGAVLGMLERHRLRPPHVLLELPAVTTRQRGIDGSV